MTKRQARLRYGLPARGDLVLVFAVIFVLALLVGALVWTGSSIRSSGRLPWMSGLVGLVIGVLLAAAWTLRDGLLRGEPRFELATRISLSLGIVGMVLFAAVWTLAPDGRLIGALAAGIIVSAWLLFTSTATAIANREVESRIIALGQGSGGRALVVFHSAHGGLMRTLLEAFADGAQSAGWRVDLSTASRLSPIDVCAYQLLVLGSPCYNRGLARPISSYLDRVGELEGIPTVIVVTGFNYTERAKNALHNRVEEANGQVVGEIELWTARTNMMRDGTADPAETMRRTGARLAETLNAAAA